MVALYGGISYALCNTHDASKIDQVCEEAEQKDCCKIRLRSFHNVSANDRGITYGHVNPLLPPEEAIEYMAKLELEIANAKAAGQEHFRYIPLYESDGITVIGTFGVPYPDE